MIPRRSSLSSGRCPSVWRCTKRGDRRVTVVIDLSPVHDASGLARLLGVVPGGSKRAFKTQLAQA